MTETAPPPRRFVIRQLASTFDGARIAAGEFRHHVQIWDFRMEKQISAFETGLDFGGMRLAISLDGQRCIAGAYDEEGIAAYDADSGKEIWRRKDLQQVQRIRPARSGTQLLCGFEESMFTVLNLETGKTQKEIRGLKDIWESYYEPLKVYDRPKKPFELVGEDEKAFGSIERKTFAALSYAFSPGKVCISESGGPVSCYDTANGKPLWTFNPGSGVHALKLGYHDETEKFFAITWPYQRGGDRKLLALDSDTGEAEELTVLSSASEYRVCSRGKVLISSKGELVDTSTGALLSTLAFFPDNEPDE